MADGYLIVGDGNATNQDVDAGGWADLQNGPDSLVLKDPQGNIVDALGWGDFGGMNFAGEGSTAVDVGEGYTLGRDGESRDTDDNATDFYVWAIPTPGELNAHPLTNAADSCSDAYTLTDGQPGRFVIEENLGANGIGNDFTTLSSGASSCIVSADPLGGADQVFAFTIPAGSMGTISLDLSETADIDIDSALTGAPCSDIDAGFIGCNYGTSNSYDMLAPGTYYLVIFEDSSTQKTGASELYRYELELTLQ